VEDKMLSTVVFLSLFTSQAIQPEEFDSCICEPSPLVSCDWPGAEIVSRDSAGVQSPSQHALNASISADGRWVVFRSHSGHYVGDPDTFYDQIYLKNLETGVIQLVSRAIGGGPADNQSFDPIVSQDGRRVAFVSFANDMTIETYAESTHRRQVYVFDRIDNTVEIISVSAMGELANHQSDYDLAFSPDGNRLAFASKASNLHPDDTDGYSNIFMFDFVSRELSLVEPATITNLPEDNSLQAAIHPSFSGVGNQLTYIQQLRKGLPGSSPVVVHDLDTDIAEIISTNSAGEFHDGGGNDQPVFSADGGSVAFMSQATNLVSGEQGIDRQWRAYVKDLRTGEVTLASRNLVGERIDNMTRAVSISSTGRYVAFVTDGNQALDAPRSRGYQVFLFDRQSGTSRLASQAYDGDRVRGHSDILSQAFSLRGQLVFESREPYVSSDDLNGTRGDIFLTGCS
jgi:Tol biopolymer transport system component